MAVFAVLVVGSVDFADAQSFQSSPTITGIGGTTVNVNIRVTPSDTTATSVEFNPFAVSDFNAAGGTVSLANRENPITVAFGLP